MKNIEYIVACSNCYKIKNGENEWIQDNVLYTKLEEQGYISHGYCPPCLEKALIGFNKGDFIEKV